MEIKVAKKTIPLRGISVKIEDILRIIERLMALVDEEGLREVSELLMQGPNDSERRSVLDAQRKEAFRITITIFGRGGEELFGYGTDPFHSPNVPDPIESIFITNSTAYRGVAGRDPSNNFVLRLDFSTPPLIDNNNPVSNPTPNYSNLTIEGSRDGWVASVENSVMDVIGKRLNKHGILHASFAYDIGLYLLGFPASFYICWHISGVIEIYLERINPIVSAAAYIYIFILSVTLYRMLFGYTKWAFPVVEWASTDNQSRTHRRFWYAILVSLIGTGIYEFFF